MSRPELSSIPSFYHRYFELAKEDDVINALEINTKDAIAFLNSIPTDKWDYSYAEGKWSIKELVQHIMDTERIFTYRALRFARTDQTPLPGFDENLFAPASKANRRTKQELIDEFEAVRNATYLLYKSLDEEQLNYTGVASNNTVSVKGIGFVIVGHVKHHINILSERYLK